MATAGASSMTLPQRFAIYRSPRPLPTLLLPLVPALYEDVMADRDVVVLGGSAGAIDGLITIVRALPADFAAAILVVVHVPATAESRLPEILATAVSAAASQFSARMLLPVSIRISR
jgi:chemotaxis response regulator CheB